MNKCKNRYFNRRAAHRLLEMDWFSCKACLALPGIYYLVLTSSNAGSRHARRPLPRRCGTAAAVRKCVLITFYPVIFISVSAIRTSGSWIDTSSQAAHAYKIGLANNKQPASKILMSTRYAFIDLFKHTYVLCTQN